MARVQLAVAEGPGDIRKLVVIKQITTTHTDDPEFVTMFLDEARLSARLRHPNVVQVHEVGEADDRPFMVMEYLDGQSLSHIRRRLARHGGIPLALHLRVLVATLRGLHHAHEITDHDGVPLHVVHRDVSPGNVFVTYDGAVRVVDFGVAKARDAKAQTRAGIIKGKVSYMPPEQARADEIDHRADVFAVGVMLWEAATGARMWGGLSGDDVLHRLAVGEIPEPRSARPDLPDALEAIIRRATAADPAQRHATAAELADELDHYLEAHHPHAQLRALGQLVASHFEAERARIRQLVHQEIGASVVRTGRFPRPSSPGFDTAPPSMQTVPGVAQVLPEAPETAPPAAPNSDRPRPWIAGGLLACAVALAGAVLLPRSSSTATHHAASPSAAQLETTPALTPTAFVAMRISASPGDARIFLDDVPLAGNPFVGDVQVKGDAVVRVEAPGHTPRIEHISLGRDRELHFALEPAEPPRGKVAQGPTPSASASGHRPTRHIDTVNPYTP